MNFITFSALKTLLTSFSFHPTQRKNLGQNYQINSNRSVKSAEKSHLSINFDLYSFT